jgi:flagellar export protein FliJ
VAPRTRLDKVVQVRERAEDAALMGLAQARAQVGRAQDRLSLAVEVSRRDGRAGGPVELWHLEELQHRRALQAVRTAQYEVRQAAQVEAKALDGYTSARRGTEIVRRVQERRRAEILGELEKRERKEIDEIATLRFNAAR